MDEKELRKTVHRVFPDWYWIEASAGGTPGLPDAFWIDVNGVHWVELKHSERLSFTLTREQRRIFPRMVKDGARMMLLMSMNMSTSNWYVIGDLSAIVLAVGGDLLPSRINLSGAPAESWITSTRDDDTLRKRMDEMCHWVEAFGEYR